MKHAKKGTNVLHLFYRMCSISNRKTWLYYQT